MDTEKQRQCRCDDTRLTKSGNTRSEQLLVVPTESQRVAALRALEWIGMSKAWLVFRYEISDFFKIMLCSVLAIVHNHIKQSNTLVPAGSTTH